MINKSANKKSFLNYINQVSKEYALSSEKVSEFLKESFKNNFLKEYSDNSIGIEIDLKKGNILMWRNLRVVSDKFFYGEGLEDWETLITVEDAKKISKYANKNLKVDDVVKKTIDINEFDLRLVKNILIYFQKLTKEETNKKIYEEWSKYKGMVLEGMVEKIFESNDQAPREIIVSLYGPNGETAKGVLNKFDLVQTESKHGIKICESLTLGNIYNFHIKDVLENSVDCPIILSRVSGEIVVNLMKKHISEIADEQIEIKAISRIAGLKSKVMVTSKKKNLDPVGCCIGPKGKRLKIISAQLLNEKIDVILWNEDPIKNVVNAFVPGKIIGYRQDGENELTLVATHENLLAAIGKKGVNAKLVYMLTGWKTNLKTIQEAKDEKIEYIPVDDAGNNSSNISKRIFDMHFEKKEDLLSKIKNLQNDVHDLDEN